MKQDIRLLAAIMFTDMVGYTAMMQENEQNAISIREKHKKILEDKLLEHQGRILQYYGDGSLSMFGSAIEAVNCALKIQIEFNKEPKIPVRVGLHLGDIVYHDEGVYGDGVNIASRIESLCQPGAILISEKIYDEIRNHPDLKARSLGSFKLKNVHKSQEIFTLIHEGIKTTSTGHIREKSESTFKSIAVLPFVNMSPDPENEYFSDGISEEILNALAQVEGIQVTARTSSFAFKGKNIDVREIGKQLNVNTIVEGSVRKVANKVRVTAQLINTVDGYHIWSETYDRKLEDIFEVQDEISQKIAHTLREKLSTSEEPKKEAQHKNVNIDAYNEYLKAKFYWNKWNPEAVRKAMGHTKKAIELEPDWVLPYVSMAAIYTFLGATGHMDSVAALSEAKVYALKSLEMDNNIADSHLSIAMIKMFYEWDWAGSGQYFKNALRINPDLAEAHHYYSIYLGVMKRYDEAIIEIKKALTLDPLSIIINVALGDALQNAERYEEAIVQYKKTLEMDPNFRIAIYSLGLAYFLSGDTEQSIEILRRAKETAGHALKGITQLGYVLARTGNEAEARECLNKLKLRAEKYPDQNLNADFAVLYSGLREYDKMFEYIEKCYSDKQGMVLFIRSPHWKDIHEDSRFKSLMKRMGLE